MTGTAVEEKPRKPSIQVRADELSPAVLAKMLRWSGQPQGTPISAETTFVMELEVIDE